MASVISNQKFPRDVKFLQRQAAEAVRKQSQATSAAVRYRFVARAAETEPPPPLARLLRGGGGRGGSTRLKLYLSMLWMARNESKPYLRYPAHQWACLLGLTDPDGAGARRVQDALHWLDAEAFIELKRHAGAPSSVRLLNDAGTGGPYEPPGIAIKNAPKAAREDHLYVQLQAGLWTNGWIVELSGAAIAMFLVLLHEQRGEDTKTVWLAPRIGRERYDLSDETRRRGLLELQEKDLILVSKRPLHQGLFNDSYRRRNVYNFNPKVFDLRDADDSFGLGAAIPAVERPVRFHQPGQVD